MSINKDQIPSILTDYYDMSVDSIGEPHIFDLTSSKGLPGREGAMEAYELEANGKKLLLVEYPKDLLADDDLMQWFKDVAFMWTDGRRNWKLISPKKPKRDYYLFDTGLKV